MANAKNHLLLPVFCAKMGLSFPLKSFYCRRRVGDDDVNKNKVFASRPASWNR